MVVDVVDFREISGSIQLESIMQCLAVLDYIELLQHAASICYCITLLKLSLVEVVMQLVFLYLFLDTDHYFTMHSWPFL